MAIKISGSTIIDDGRNIVNAGVVTATSFSGDGSGITGVSGIAQDASINTSGIITASSFVGNLTGTASTATAAGTAYGLTGSPDVTVGVLTATNISAGSTIGNEGQVLQSTGVGVTWADSASGGISITDSNVIGYNSAGIRSDAANGRLEVFGTGNFQVFTSPGTYVVNPGISSIRVRVIGAGGNGGSGSFPSPPSTNNKSGGGGGGGGYAHKVITSFTAPRSYTVTVGSAPGGTSSFGSEVSATGGSNGGPGAGGNGGSGSSGDFNASGATGLAVPSGPDGGRGGASGTQKGNGSGASVPGIPGNVFNSRRYVSRFPFDIFEGHEGYTTPSPSVVFAFNPSVDNVEKLYRNGHEGGSGGTFRYVTPGGSQVSISGGPGGVGAGGGGGVAYISNGSGGIGGIGGGGGGGSGSSSPGGPAPGGPGGSGGPGIVIVEW